MKRQSVPTRGRHGGPGGPLSYGPAFELDSTSNTEEVIFEGERLCVDASTACRYEDFYATSNTEEVIIDDERLCVDARTACRYEDFYATSNS